MINLIVQRQTNVILSRPLSSAPVTIGGTEAADVQLPDTGLNALHARLERRKKDWWLVPQPNATVYVNARIITDPVVIRVNDIINIGEFSLYLSAETDADMTQMLPVKTKFFRKFSWRWLLLLIVILVAVFAVFQPDYQARHSHICPHPEHSVHNHNHNDERAHEPAELATTHQPIERILQKVRRLKADGDVDSLFAAKQLLGPLVFQQKSDSVLLAEFIKIDQHLYQQLKTASKPKPSVEQPESTITADQKAQFTAPPNGALNTGGALNVKDEGNQPPVVRDFWLLRDAVLRGARTPAVVLAHDPDGDSLTFEWNAFYGSIIGSGANVLYVTPEKLPPFSEDLVTVTVSDGKNQAQQFFKSVQVLDAFPIVSEQKLVAREFYNLALVYEIHYQDLEKAEEYLRKVMFVAPDTNFSVYRSAKKRLEEISDFNHKDNMSDF